eukprot:359590-Chlamydomonas_euryale.AAC.9
MRSPNAVHLLPAAFDCVQQSPAERGQWQPQARVGTMASSSGRHSLHVSSRPSRNAAHELAVQQQSPCMHS